MSTLAAFDLLVVLGTNSIENLKLIDKYITDLFYTGKHKIFIIIGKVSFFCF